MMPEWNMTDWESWSTDTEYSYGDMVTPDNGYAYKVVSNGTSGTEPEWPTDIGDTVTDDNGIEYECWGYDPLGTLKYKAEVFDIPVPYKLPREYYGFFEINGPLTGARRHHAAANKLSLGGTRERILADTLWDGSGGRYPDDETGISGKVWRSEVYGFYILWGLRWIEIAMPYIPFGFAKCFPIQPKVELKQVSPDPNAEDVSPSQSIRIIKNP
jgi:hypothetical protein